jgi:hypothetical protein
MGEILFLLPTRKNVSAIRKVQELGNELRGEETHI